jgi:hypothetical protein
MREREEKERGVVRDTALFLWVLSEAEARLNNI